MNVQPDILCIFSHKNWVAEDFNVGIKEAQLENAIKLIHSYGLDIPDEVYQSDKAGLPVAYWVPSFLAAQLQRAGIAQGLTSPGSNFMSAIPQEISGRKIITQSIAEFITTHHEKSYIFAKPAEAKLDYFMAGRYAINDLHALINQHNIPKSTMIQYTPTILHINYEHRLYICDGLVVTGSAYLMDNCSYYDNINNVSFQEKLSEAVAYGQDIIDSIPEQPAAFTLDVAWNAKTEQWFVLEANPAWCSGIYGSDVEAVIHTIQRSCNPQNTPEKEFLWKPDSLLIEKALAQPLLPIFNNNYLQSQENDRH